MKSEFLFIFELLYSLKNNSNILDRNDFLTTQVLSFDEGNLNESVNADIFKLALNTLSQQKVSIASCHSKLIQCFFLINVYTQFTKLLVFISGIAFVPELCNLVSSVTFYFISFIVNFVITYYVFLYDLFTEINI